MARTLALSLMAALAVVATLKLTIWKPDPAPARAELPAPTTGDRAPAFTLTDQHGTPFEVGGESDQWTILTFFRQAQSPW